MIHTMFNLIKKYKFEILVFILLILLRLPNLGFDSFNTDVWRWKSRIYDFGTGISTANFEKTLQMYHPGVTLMWVGFFAVKIYNLHSKIFNGGLPTNNEVETIFGLNFLQTFLIALVISFSLTLIFHILKKHFGTRYSFLAIIFMSLEPFYSALTRVVHLEGLMSTFMLVSFIGLYDYIDSAPKKFKSLYISAIFTALSLLTKSSSLFLLPFSLLMLGISNFLSERNIAKTVKITAKEFIRFILCCFVVFVVLWPVMWVNPIRGLSEYFTGINSVGIEGGHEQIFLGKVTFDPGLLFYPLVLFYRISIPLLFGLVGFVAAFKKIDKKIKVFSFYLFLFAVLYFIEISIPSKKLDRYVLPTILGISFISSIFYSHLLIKRSFLNYFVLLTALLITLFSVIQIRTDYLSYYNPLGGGLSLGIHVFEPKWLIGQKEISNFFREEVRSGRFKPYSGRDSFYNVKKNRDRLTVAFQEKYYTQIWPMIRRIGGWAILEELTPEANKTNFFVYPVWDDTSYVRQSYNLRYVSDIKIRGVSVYRVYKRDW